MLLLGLCVIAVVSYCLALALANPLFAIGIAVMIPPVFLLLTGGWLEPMKSFVDGIFDTKMDVISDRDIMTESNLELLLASSNTGHIVDETENDDQQVEFIRSAIVSSKSTERLSESDKPPVNTRVLDEHLETESKVEFLKNHGIFQHSRMIYIDRDRCTVAHGLHDSAIDTYTNILNRPCASGESGMTA